MNGDDYRTISKHLLDAENWKCEMCGQDPTDDSDGSWRWNGASWEHYHGYQIGHIESTKKERE